MGTPAGANSPSSSAAAPKRRARSRALSVCVSTAYPLAVDLARTRFGQLVPDEYLFRNHVGWAVLYGVPTNGVEGVTVGVGAVPQGDNGDDIVAYRGVLHPEGA